MKKLFLPILIISFLLIGCLETTEGLLINENGSGSYTMDIDISGMFALMDIMKAEDSTAGSGIPEDRKNFDSTVLFKSFVDTATDLTAEEKELLHNAVAHIKMNEKEKVFKIKMTYPFVKIDDVAKIIALNGSGKGSNKIQKIFKGNTGGQEETDANPNLPDFNDMYQMIYKDGLLERKIKPEKLKEFEEQLKMAGENGMEEMISSVKMNNVIKLPRPAKSVQGEKVKLSADKKTVTINCSMKDILTNPKAVEYSIQY
jgi:DnaJ-class molecular chaperone